MVNIGEAIGIIAAQSIGEPGTQLTMRTFHTGGVDLRKASVNNITSGFKGEIKFPSSIKTSYLTQGKKKQLLIEDAVFTIKTAKSDEVVILPTGSILQVKDGQKINKDEVLALYDSSSQYAASHTEGVVRVYKQDDEYQVAVYNAAKEQTLEVSTDKIQGFKKFDKLGITTD